ncbi:MAG: hypothetical protein JO184_13895 [Gammaproteobacteria bacterium]|nr:hypothetical protein [Gammaproteobacteria bacterium]MBV8404153.1 hypothetical protein [Gammaproteobacteria bacterium]
MLKTSLLATCLIALAACAGNPPAAPRNATANAANSSGSPLGCVNKTATRLPTSQDECAGFGNSHSDEAIKSTGQPQAQNALRLLDPTVSVH